MLVTMLVLATALSHSQDSTPAVQAPPAQPVVTAAQPAPAAAEKTPPKVVVHRVPGPEPAPAPRDPTLISVPSNTLATQWIAGPDGRVVAAADTQEPLWVRSDRASAEARLARARADEAELTNELLKLERADDRFGRRAYYGGFGYGGIIGLRGGVAGGTVGGLRGPVTVTTRGFNDAFDQAQLRFGRNATPPIIGIQNQTDQAINNSRKPATSPE